MVEIRSCHGVEELDACVRLEIDTWGYDETEVVPRKTFLLAQHIGGQVMGAFQTREQGTEIREQRKDEARPAELVGFVMSLPGIQEGQNKAFPYLHSHMLAVRPGERNRGIGLQLKWAQRREALGRGIRHMEWTFDPLEIKNAYLNIHRLGAICRRYRENFYGVSSSRLQGGLPTDRLLAEWELDSCRVQQAEDEHPPVQQVIQERIVVPASIEQWKTSETDRGRALAVQVENRRKFQQAFSRGWSVVGFRRDGEGNGVYELGLLAE